MDSKSLHDPVEPVYDARIRGALLISTVHGKRVHMHGGCWAAPCSYDPPRFMVSVPKEFEGAALIAEGGRFAVTLLAADQRAFNDAYFSGRHGIDELGREQFVRTPGGCPVLAGGVAFLDARLWRALDLGDFLLAIGDVSSAGILHGEKRNLTVNEIVAQADPRGSREAVLPYEGQDFDMSVLETVPQESILPAESGGLKEVHARRAWGLFMVSVQHEEEAAVYVSPRVIQLSHEPPRFAAVFPHGGDGASLLADGGRMTFSLLGRSQSLWVRGLGELPQEPSPETLQAYGIERHEGWGLRAGGAVAHFTGGVEAVHDVGDGLLALVAVKKAEWEKPDEPNLTTAG